MKYIITGSIGHISKPVTKKLTEAGHQVTVITSKPNNAEEIKALGAHPAVGSVEDRNFLTKTFAGADAVYLMIPPHVMATDLFAHQKQVVDNYIAAVEANHVKHVVILSSIGAHLRKGCGPVDGAAYLEEQSGTWTRSNVQILRPSYFYYNLLGQIGMIKNAGFTGSTQPADFKLILTHPSDIANVAAERLLLLNFTGSNIEYIASDDTQTWASITKALGTSIGKPELPFVQLTDEQFLGGLSGAGIGRSMAESFVTMGQALRSGKMQEDYFKNNIKPQGKVKLNDFVKEFAAAFNAPQTA